MVFIIRKVISIIFICNFSIFFGANGQKKILILDSLQETYACKGKWKTCFNTLESWYRTERQTIIYNAILIALTSKGFPYFALLPITPCALTFPSLETSCKPLRRREGNLGMNPEISRVNAFCKESESICSRVSFSNLLNCRV
jgi:hypothetical protein